MAERSTQKFARTNNKLSEKNFPPGPRFKNKAESVNYDELISLLAQSYENRRAVQAFEWESIRRGTEMRTFN